MFHSKKFIWQFGGSPPPHSFSQCPFCWGSLASHKWSIAFVFFCRRIEWKKGKTIGARKKNPLNNSHRALIVPIHFSCPFASLSSLIIRAGQQKKIACRFAQFWTEATTRVQKTSGQKNPQKLHYIHTMGYKDLFFKGLQGRSDKCSNYFTIFAGFLTMQGLQFFLWNKKGVLALTFFVGAPMFARNDFFMSFMSLPPPPGRKLFCQLCVSPPPLPPN